ncbi:MAG TPA: MBL fold metallo-hydrolase [Bdellovibrionales bacterium]|nr:MBL fold metallo-hydrolase [Bdellovibrionales bacterium]
MKVHHLNCGTYCTRAIPFVLDAAKLCTRCLLIESNDGLIAVDSGYGEADLFKDNLKADLSHKLFAEFPRPEETLKYHVTRLGFRAQDVRHIVLTHLDPDHAGGLKDFPDAQVHVYSFEYYKALQLRDTNPIWGYRLRGIDWSRAKQWRLYDDQGERWNGLECLRPLSGIKEELALIPLAGHTPGHAGILVGSKTLHVGDLYYHSSELEKEKSRYSALSTLLAFDNGVRIKNLARVAEIKKNDPGLDVFSAHDYESWLHRHAGDRNA